MDGITKLLTGIVSLISDILIICHDTAEMLNGVNFDESIMANYLGYARYVFGAPLWALFCTVLLVPLGVTVWVWTLAGIDKVKTLLPW